MTARRVHFFGNARIRSSLQQLWRACNGTVPKQCKASMMATKLILEGARSFKTVPLSDPNEPANRQAEHSRWRWPVWPSIGSNRRDLYLIDIRPRRLPGA